MNKHAVPLTLAFFGLTIFASSAQAQRQVAFRFASEIRIGSPGPRSTARGSFVRMRRSRSYYNGSLFASPFYSDSDYGPEAMVEPPPQAFSPSAQSASPRSAPKPAESVVLELQGDHWVRLTNYGQSQTGQFLQLQPDQRSATPVSRQIQPAERPIDLPLAVLVFRDGHQEQIGKYVIKDAAVYASADYYATGSWTKKIQIAALNVPATLKLNRDRGTNFTLPSGPHEVMIRP
jgi:hypothetical protein